MQKASERVLRIDKQIPEGRHEQVSYVSRYPVAHSIPRKTRHAGVRYAGVNEQHEVAESLTHGNRLRGRAAAAPTAVLFKYRHE